MRQMSLVVTLQINDKLRDLLRCSMFDDEMVAPTSFLALLIEREFHAD